MRTGFLIALVVTGLSTAASADVGVFLDRDGGTDAGVTIPRFAGTDRTWQAMTTCVKANFAAFRVDVGDRRPARGTYITVLVGGRASQLELDDDSTAGVGPYSGEVIHDAVVHVFAENIGANEVAALCATASHEIGHALGLDHSRRCGDLMSYDNDRCGTQRFVDADAACGEFEDRACGNGDDTQNSYRRLAEMIGLRARPEPQLEPESASAEPDSESESEPEPESESEPDSESDPAQIEDDDEAPPAHACG